VVRHILQACLVWIYTQSNIASITRNSCEECNLLFVSLMS
jgi:hypothetical protein